MFTVPTDNDTGPDTDIGSDTDTGTDTGPGAGFRFGTLVADSELLHLGVIKEDSVARGVTLTGGAATYVGNRSGSVNGLAEYLGEDGGVALSCVAGRSGGAVRLAPALTGGGLR